MEDLQLFQATSVHYMAILQLWEASVRATHYFLREEDLQFYKKKMEHQYLKEVNLFGLQTSKGQLVGFMGVSQMELEMLFIHPQHMRKGLGKALVQTATQSLGISKTSVNEQNHSAVNFYKKCGFEVINRSETDAQGKPYPILHLEISSAQAAMFVDWDNYADSWESTPGVKDFAQLCFKDLNARFKLQGLRILDFGCGTGLLTQLLHAAGAQVVAVDSSAKMIEMLNVKKLNGVQTLVSELNAADIYNQEVLQKPFDLIIASSVLAFIPNQQEKLEQLKGLLHPQGSFIQWDWQKLEEQADFGFHSNELQDLYEQVGLNVITIAESFSVDSENGRFAALIGHAQL